MSQRSRRSEQSERLEDDPVVMCEPEHTVLHSVGDSNFAMYSPSGDPIRDSHTDHESNDHHRSVGDQHDGSFYIPENEIEAHRMHNNYLFGFKKWKSHVTARPLSVRSEIVQDLYTDKMMPVRVSTIRPTNIIYVIFIGWWLALIYLIVSALMFLTIMGRDYSHLCMKLAKFFLWPFGKFVHQIHQKSLNSAADEAGYLIPKSRGFSCSANFWKRQDTYIWLILGVPLLTVVHATVFLVTWLLVFTIPIAKLNLKAITKLMYLPPEEIEVGDSGIVEVDLDHLHSEILMYTHQSVNVYYYKYTVDGMNVILVNLLLFVIIAIALGFGDPHNVYTSSLAKFLLASVAVIPLTYYIGMAIASISAQSVLAVGAVLNATFGSLVEISLYVIMLMKGVATNDTCYVEFVKTSMTGTLLVTILFIPGICMMVGGFKYRMQKFNPLTAGVSATLLFVAVVGSFLPSLFADIFGTLNCSKCEKYSPMNVINATTNASVNNSTGLACSDCKRSIFGLDDDNTLYNDHILPLVYTLAVILPLSYIIGLVFTLKTHTSHLYDEFNAENAPAPSHHGSAQWGRMKSIVILMVCCTLIALCADIITEHISPILMQFRISEYFIGVTILAVLPDLPEVVNGIQFALQDNVSLGIEVGSSTAVQVCLIQIPVMILANLIYPTLSFNLIFNSIHLWAVVFAVILFNYVVQDGKSDYFQGSMLVVVYIIMLVMYFYCPVPKVAQCKRT